MLDFTGVPTIPICNDARQVCRDPKGSPRDLPHDRFVAVRLQEQPVLEPPPRCVPKIPNGLPDLVGHVGYLGVRADAAIAALNDHLTWLGRHFEASGIPVRQELFTRACKDVQEVLLLQPAKLAREAPQPPARR
jgi:hypothetical protein